MPNPLIALAQWCYRRPWPVLSVSCAALLTCLVGSWMYLGLQMDWTNLFSPHDPFIRRELAARREFPFPKDMVVLVTGGPSTTREAFVRSLAERLEREPHLFRHVLYRLDLDFALRHALFYLPPEQLVRLRDELRFLRPYLVAMQDRPDLVALLEQFQRDLRPGAESSRTRQALAMANRLLDGLDRTLRRRDLREREPQDLLAHLVPAGAPGLEGQSHLYTTLEGGTVHVLLVQPATTDDPFTPAGASVDGLREAVRETRRQFPLLRARVTGEPVLLTDERRTCQEDSTRTSWIALLVIAGLFILGFGEARRPMMAMFALVVGLGLAMGFATLVVGHLNFITVTYVSMLAGEGIAFGIHLTFRYSQERERGRGPVEALRETMGQTGANVVVAAVATAVSFFVMLWTGFLGVAELGLIAGVGVLLVCLTTVTVLPACLALHERVGGGRRGLTRAAAALAVVEERVQRFPGPLVLALSVFSLFCLTWAGVPRFDYNLLHMQDPSLESIQAELEMIQKGQTTALPAVSLAPSLEEAALRGRQFSALPTVSRVVSLADLLPPAAGQLAPLVRAVLEPVTGLAIHPARPLEGAEDLLELEAALERTDAAFQRARRRLAADPGVAAEARRFEMNLAALRRQADALGPGPLLDAFDAVQLGLVADLREALSMLGRQQPLPPSLAEVPAAVRVRSVGTSGKIAVRVQSSQNIWEREPLERFAADVTAVDPAALGEPILMVHFGDVIADTHRRFAWNTFLAVSLVMFLYLRSWRILLLSMIPTGLGVLWMMGVMGLCGMNFNPANFVSLPMIVGIGAIYGVHVLHRMEEEGTAAILSHSTGPAVLLSGLNTIAGFGSLLLAHHPGIASLGFMISVGVGANLVASLLLLPALYRLWRGSSHGPEPTGPGTGDRSVDIPGSSGQDPPAPRRTRSDPPPGG